MKNKITILQYSTLTFFLLTSFFMNSGLYILIKLSKNDSIFSILLGGLLILVFQFFTLYMNRNYKENILVMIKKKSLFIQIIFYLIVFIIVFICTIYSLNNLVNFIHYYIVKETSLIIINITLVSTIIYITSKGIHTIAKLSEVFFYIYIFFLLFGFIGLIKYVDLSNIKPLFINNINNISTSFLIYFLSSLLPLFLLQVIPKKEVDITSKNKKIIYIFIIGFILITLIQFIMIISILGINLASIYQNADMILYKKISFLNVLERVEVLLSFINILNNLFIIILSTYFVKDIVSNIIGKKKEHITIALIGITIILFSSICKFSFEIYLIINILVLILYFFLFIFSFGNKGNHLQ